MIKKHVLIIGGGFAGMAVLQGLAGKQEVHITLLDRHNYHQFKPLLYQVATSALTPDDAATTFRRAFEDYSNINIKMAEAIRATGNAKADAYRAGVQALGTQGYTAVQLMQIIGDQKVKVVPEVSVSGGAGAGLTDGLLGVLLRREVEGK